MPRPQLTRQQFEIWKMHETMGRAIAYFLHLGYFSRGYERHVKAVWNQIDARLKHEFGEHLHSEAWVLDNHYTSEELEEYFAQSDRQEAQCEQ